MFRTPILQANCLLAILSLLPTVYGNETAQSLLGEAQRAAASGDSQAAVDLATQSIKADATLEDAYYLRGRENFRLGLVDAAVKDFDWFVDRKPDLASRQWERGIALYYAGEFKRGAAQFELYQTFHNRDVENSVWRFLCMVPTHGVAEARAAMLPIEHDRRPIMPLILQLFRGTLQPADVLEAASAGNPPPNVLEAQLFYTHLYLGLYYHALEERELSKRHIRFAADTKYRRNPHVNYYMRDVARIHARRNP